MIVRMRLSKYRGNQVKLEQLWFNSIHKNNLSLCWGSFLHQQSELNTGELLSGSGYCKFVQANRDASAGVERINIGPFLP